MNRLVRDASASTDGRGRKWPMPRMVAIWKFKTMSLFLATLIPITCELCVRGRSMNEGSVSTDQRPTDGQSSSNSLFCNQVPYTVHVLYVRKISVTPPEVVVGRSHTTAISSRRPLQITILIVSATVVCVDRGLCTSCIYSENGSFLFFLFRTVQFFYPGRPGLQSVSEICRCRP